MSSLLFVYCGIKCGKSETFFLLKINSSSRCLCLLLRPECEKMKVYFLSATIPCKQRKRGKAYLHQFRYDSKPRNELDCLQSERRGIKSPTFKRLFFEKSNPQKVENVHLILVGQTSINGVISF